MREFMDKESIAEIAYDCEYIFDAIILSDSNKLVLIFFEKL